MFLVQPFVRTRPIFMWCIYSFEIKVNLPLDQVLYQDSSSSSCRAASTDIAYPLSPLLLIVHRLWQIFRSTTRILTELLYVYSSWSSCFCPAICGGP